MLLLIYRISSGIIMMATLLANNIFAQVLELGSSELHGKKDQPEAMTFISRARMDIKETSIPWHPTEEIAKEINSEVFSLTNH